MKILKRQIDKQTNSGIVVLLPNKADDMYHLYNLINTGDLITSTTIRNVYNNK
jgi:protein pelota